MDVVETNPVAIRSWCCTSRCERITSKRVDDEERLSIRRLDGRHSSVYHVNELSSYFSLTRLSACHKVADRNDGVVVLEQVPA